jgi:hypothetical protein
MQAPVSRSLHVGDAVPVEPPDDRELSDRGRWIGLVVFALASVIAILLVTTGDPAPVAALPR